MGYFKNIKLVNFRNFDKYSLDFSNKCNVLYGKNGTGKTNILEALSLLSKGRGLRKDKISNIVKINKERFIIKSDYYNDEIIYNLISETQQTNYNLKKILIVNSDKSNESLNKIYEIVSFLYFLPETERLFMSSPSKRRNFIDQLIFTYTNHYNKTINKYNKYIQERSKILCNNQIDESWLSQLEKNISKYGLEIYLLQDNKKPLYC